MPSDDVFSRPLRFSRLLRLLTAALLTAALPGLIAPPAARAQPRGAQPQGAAWTAYGGDAGGTRYSPLDEITPANVADLAPAWTYRTGELGDGSPVAHKLTFEATPILFEETLYLTTAFGAVVALDAATGAERWRYDPGVDRSVNYSELASRGVSLWVDGTAGDGASGDGAAGDGPCGARLVYGTIDARLIALDARTGRPCADFGRDGQIDLAGGYRVDDNLQYMNYQVTSPPAVVGDVVVVGSSIGDNWRADTGRGAVRAFDVRTGALRWTWDPIPHVPGRAGAANAWSVFSADPARDLVFVPTGSPSPDFYGGLRPGDDRHANSVVALRASTGELAWAFQTVHHDLWDYDVAAQPTLVTVTRGGEAVPAVAQATKMGSLFVLHRETGEPLFPVEERPVPSSDVPGETAAPTQPFPTLPRALMPQGPLLPEEAFGVTEEDREACRALLEGHDNAGIFTPPSLRGTIAYPGNASGTNWGGVAFDPRHERLFVTTSRFATLVQLVPSDSLETERARAEAAGEAFEFGAQRGAPYAVKRRTLLSPSGIPCNPPPWGTLAAVDLATGEVRWEVPVGDYEGQRIGLPNAGGPVVTAGGLVFLGATMDGRFRAFDAETGEMLWSTDLPRSAIATPMTYEAGGRQYVVVAAGGHGKMGLPTGDYVVAFALP